MNDWQKSRFSGRMVSDLFNTVTGKQIGILGFAFKKDTNDTRETPAISVCRDLLSEGAKVYVYDPQVSEVQIRAEVLGTETNPNLVVVKSALEACKGAHGVAVLTECLPFMTLSTIAATSLDSGLLFGSRSYQVMAGDRL